MNEDDCVPGSKGYRQMLAGMVAPANALVFHGTFFWCFSLVEVTLLHIASHGQALAVRFHPFRV